MTQKLDNMEMTRRQKEVFLIIETTPHLFENKVNECLKEGWEISSSSCSTIRLTQQDYDYGTQWLAIMVKYEYPLMRDTSFDMKVREDAYSRIQFPDGHTEI